MLSAILRSHLAASSPTDPSFSFFLSPQQQSTLEALLEALRQKHTADAVECCQSFLWTVVSAKDQGGWTDVIQQWIWLKALRPDGNFYPASSFTPDLAKLKYIMRQTVLIQAFVEHFQDDEELIK